MDPNKTPDALLDDVGAAFSRLRRRTNQALTDHGMTKRDLTRNLIINVVDEADGEMTVGAVADQLNVDPSVASRMVTDCIDSGYLQRAASAADGRRTVLRLAPAGVELRDRFSRLQRETFEQITSAWTDADRLELARLLTRYADDSGRYA
ncbi:DNA-binding MarR family transcriptional regulator [Cryobacterium sp. MP_3.1]|uniref:MarR family winged helix-turn-helix transcriptional regulator n=1 Tax=Cryobacterium sp. MP_3.1 TaxID=3071711 RepID=UPI002E04083E|nr:DNA-binding MarR family transcriptional regulator [Cryobacterium sp. MP_3.1]